MSARREVPWGPVVAAACLLAAGAAAEAVYRARVRPAPAPEAFELYVVGESSAFGQPYGPELSFARLAGLMLGDKLAGRALVVRSLARPGDTIHPQLAAFERAMLLRGRGGPAALLVYAGHNEAFEASRPQTEGERLYDSLKDGLASRSVMLGDLIAAAERKLSVRGLRDRPTYERRLRRLLRAARAAGVEPVLSTMASNVRGVEPNAGCPSPAAGGGPCEAGLAALSRAQALEDAGRREAAEKAYRAALPEAGGLRALFLFRLARLAEARGRAAAAKPLYAEALEADPPGNFGRAKPSFNELLRGTAKDLGVPLVDSEAALAARSPAGVTGPELMADGHHPNIEGALLIAEGFARELARRFGQEPPRRMSSAEAFARADYPAARRARAELESGIWLLFVSVGHPSPRLRLELAEKRLRAALALEPGSLEAALGLALAAAGKKGGLDGRKELVEALAFPQGCALDEKARAAVPSLRADGAAPELLRVVAEGAGAGCRGR